MTPALRRLWKGARWSERYGSHPGTPVLVMLVTIGGIAGSWPGALVMLLTFGPMWLFGAWERGR
jgi:hypothetical protein